MRSLSLFMICLMACVYSYGQSSGDSATIARRDSIRMAKMLKSAIYPLIKSAEMGGVIQVNSDEQIDPSMQYKLLMNFTQPIKADKAKEMNSALAEIARIINLHIAAGVPKSNLSVVVIAHGGGLFALQDNDHYRKKFKTDNPNEKIFKELQDAGVQFVVCGQAMKFLDLEKEQLMPGIKLAYSAKTVISTYSLKGYILTDVND